jgi:hypothetical protein
MPDCNAEGDDADGKEEIGTLRGSDPRIFAGFVALALPFV